MRRTSLAEHNCSTARALELLGDRWTLLILRDAMFGVTRFEEFRERLGVARNILTTRLDDMVGHGLLERRPYDAARCRYDYVLTDKGRATWPILMAMRQWGDTWIAGEGREPLQFVHRSCRTPTTAQLTCDCCGEPLQFADLTAVAGPGLTDPSLLPKRSNPTIG